MIASPLDEAGLMISEVKKDGTLAFIPLESIAPTLPSASAGAYSDQGGHLY